MRRNSTSGRNSHRIWGSLLPFSAALATPLDRALNHELGRLVLKSRRIVDIRVEEQPFDTIPFATGPQGCFANFG